jgi:hypothetical protein
MSFIGYCLIWIIFLILWILMEDKIWMLTRNLFLNGGKGR